MSADDNKAIVHRLFNEMNRGHLEIIDEVFAPNYVLHPLWPNPVPLGDVAPDASDLERMKAAHTHRKHHFPDGHGSIDDLLATDDRVAVISTFQGTDRQGRQVRWQGMSIDRFVDGKIVESWLLWDRLGFFQQLGVVPRTEDLLHAAGM